MGIVLLKSQLRCGVEFVWWS